MERDTIASALGPYAALPHVALFPFMSKGHINPLLHLACVLHRRRLATFTFFTTPGNSPYVRSALSFIPCRQSGIPAGVESTDELPSMSLFLDFVNATKRLRPEFELALGAIRPRPSLLISDGFLGWTVESARDLGIRRLSSYGMGFHTMTVNSLLLITRPHASISSEGEPFEVPGLGHVQFTKGDLSPPFDDPCASTPLGTSFGLVMNSFYEMEAAYADHWHRHFTKAWCVGPLLLGLPEERSLRGKCAEWLDARAAEGRPVLYVSFGTQAELPVALVEEVAAGLENSGADFLWVQRRKESSGFAEMAGGRGLVASEWVPQTDHCGWNSVLESVCAGVPILALPLMADQPLNAKFVVEELGIGQRVRTVDGTRRDLVKREDIEEMVRELLAGEKGREAAARMAELRIAARRAMEDGGSSWRALEEMVGGVSSAAVAVGGKVSHRVPPRTEVGCIKCKKSMHHERGREFYNNLDNF
ncbi:unnamed protein product [Spirodela intermedia]|uniref:Uncharacterized protein n=1 Tax=Spirodela intermedia TaxID=51605 RepID=A0A7I8IWH7_SPIIN|nr:unnamed protein product [Spirodela intermedia]CAA6661491.1 unnamed protein product [Spirodela intermedia]